MVKLYCPRRHNGTHNHIYTPKQGSCKIVKVLGASKLKEGHFLVERVDFRQVHVPKERVRSFRHLDGLTV